MNEPILKPEEIKALQLRNEREQLVRILEGTVTVPTRKLLEDAIEGIDAELRDLQRRPSAPTGGSPARTGEK